MHVPYCVPIQIYMLYFSFDFYKLMLEGVFNVKSLFLEAIEVCTSPRDEGVLRKDHFGIIFTVDTRNLGRFVLLGSHCSHRLKLQRKIWDFLKFHFSYPNQEHKRFLRIQMSLSECLPRLLYVWNEERERNINRLNLI